MKTRLAAVAAIATLSLTACGGQLTPEQLPHESTATPSATATK